MRLLTRQGYVIEERGMTYLADPDPENALAPLQAAASTTESCVNEQGLACMPKCGSPSTSVINWNI